MKSVSRQIQSKTAEYVWPILSFAAQNKLTITFDELDKFLAYNRCGISDCIWPIICYCDVCDIPHLNAIVIPHKTKNLSKLQRKIFDFNWRDYPQPSFGQLLKATPLLKLRDETHAPHIHIIRP